METKITESTSPNYNGPTDPDNDFMCATQLQRIADSLAEILRLCLLYTSPSPRDGLLSRMPSSA